MVLDYFAGLIGGVAGVLVGHPLDTVKVHLQTDDPKNPKYRGTFHCLRTILYRDKVFGLYRGISSPMAGIGMVNAIVFGVYGNVQRFREDPSALSTHCIAGATAGFIQSFICAPMELAKTRLQLEKQIDSGLKFKGPLSCLNYIIRTEGIRAGFKGLTATAARDVPGFAGYFVSYEYLMKQRERPSALYTLFAGGLAGQFSWLVCYPVDVVKTKMQADGLGKNAKYKSFMDCSIKGYQNEGTRFFFRGLTSTLLRAFPMNAVCFLVVSCILELADSHKFDMILQSNNKPFNVITMDNPNINFVHLKEPNDEELVRKMVVPNVHTFSEPPDEISYRWESDDKRNNVLVEDKYYLYENDRIIWFGD